MYIHVHTQPTSFTTFKHQRDWLFQLISTFVFLLHNFTGIIKRHMPIKKKNQLLLKPVWVTRVLKAMLMIVQRTSKLTFQCWAWQKSDISLRTAMCTKHRIMKMLAPMPFIRVLGACKVTNFVLSYIGLPGISAWSPNIGTISEYVLGATSQVPVFWGQYCY